MKIFQEPNLNKFQDVLVPGALASTMVKLTKTVLRKTQGSHIFSLKRIEIDSKLILRKFQNWPFSPSMRDVKFLFNT